MKPYHNLRASLYILAGFVLSYANAQEVTFKQGLSLLGAPALAKDFSHFPYVNPTAPKGGELRLAAFGTYDSFNVLSIKGDLPSGVRLQGLIYETLMVDNHDEAASSYGLVAEAVAHPDDFSSVTYRLRKQARFHDGHPITAEDVIFSLEKIKEINPLFRAYYADVTHATATGEHEVTFHFAIKGNRELPFITGQMPILPKHYWTAEGRDLTKTTLVPPLGSGPYRIANQVNADGVVTDTSHIIYERVADYWAKDLNVNIGHYNFDHIRIDYYRDTDVVFEAFKAGDVDFRAENVALKWQRGYNFPAVQDGRVKRELVTLQNVKHMQAIIFNMRKSPFDDILVRQALLYALDFEWMEKNLFFNQYARTNSYFEGSELAANGLPSDAELRILEPLRDVIPAEVFSKTFANPKTNGSGENRKNLRQAYKLFQQAGWQVENGKLMKAGKPLQIEFLIVQKTMERVLTPYLQSLKKIGVEGRIRIVDSSQYQNRVNEYDFDAIIAVLPQSLSPGNEQRDYFSSAVVDRPGGRNYAGIADKAIDRLIDHIIYADHREALVTAVRAMDRVLLWNYYTLPLWHAPYERLAYWQGLARPQRLPHHYIDFPHIWWRDGAAPYQQRSPE